MDFDHQRSSFVMACFAVTAHIILVPEHFPKLAGISTALGAMYSTTAVIDIFGVFSASMVRVFHLDRAIFVETPRSLTATAASHPSLCSFSIHLIITGHRMRVCCGRVVFCLIRKFLSANVSSIILTPLFSGRFDPPMCCLILQR